MWEVWIDDKEQWPEAPPEPRLILHAPTLELAVNMATSTLSEDGVLSEACDLILRETRADRPTPGTDFWVVSVEPRYVISHRRRTTLKELRDLE